MMQCNRYDDDILLFGVVVVLAIGMVVAYFFLRFNRHIHSSRRLQLSPSTNVSVEPTLAFVYDTRDIKYGQCRSGAGDDTAAT